MWQYLRQVWREQGGWLNWQRAILVTAAILVSTYLVAVLTYGQLVPDIGLVCIFSPEVLRVNREQIAESSLTPETKLKGYVVVELGPYSVRTWPDLLRALRDLKAPEDPELNQPTHRFVQGEEQVLVRLRPPAGDDVVDVWCRVDRSPVESFLPSMLWFFLKGGLFLVSWLVYWKRPNDRSAAQFFVLSLVTVGAFMGGYHWWRLVGMPALILVFMVCGILLPAVNLHFYLLFPRSKPFLQRHPVWTLGILYGVPLAFLFVIVADYFQLRGLVRNNQFGELDRAVESALENLLQLIFSYLAVAAAWFVACVVCLVHSFWRAADTTERNQVKCLLFGSVLALVPISYTLYLAFFEREKFGSGSATWPMFAASAFITAAYAISITRYRLLQIDQVLTSGMVYFLISFLAGVVYYVVFAAMLALGGSSGPFLGNALVFSASALVLTIVLDLARSRIKRALDRRFHKEKRHLDQTLQQMGQALEQLVDPVTLARRLLQTSAELLGVTRGAIYLRQGNPPLYRLADTLGPAPALAELAPGCPLVDMLLERSMLTARHEPWAPGDSAQGQLRFLGGEIAHALTHEGQLLALLVLGPKDSGPYLQEDFNLLSAFAQITALALENAERHRTIEVLNRDLQDKVDKISEQQRRIMTLQSQLTRQATAPADAAGSSAGQADPSDGEAGSRAAEIKTGIVGSSPVVRQLLQLVKKVSQSQSSVLLQGESGTGKELLARALHDNSARSGKAFVKVHCAALAAGLLESELFGHVKGAFTGAHRDKVGRFELANGGTLFLDEIGDISLEVQTKLLRVLQEMTFERVGSSEPVQVDVRILAATHQDLEGLIRQGRFREDLYYRLNVISIQVPSLRERRDDIAELAQHFLRFYARRAGRDVTQIDDDALSALKGFSWPGNIRQLENVIERAVVVVEGPTVTLHDLPPELHSGLEPAPAPDPLVPAAPRPRAAARSRREERAEKEKELLVRALAAAAGNKAEAARTLGLARSTLLSKLKTFGLS